VSAERPVGGKSSGKQAASSVNGQAPAWRIEGGLAVTSSFESENRHNVANFAASLKRVISDHDPASARHMVFASVAAATVIGVGIFSAAGIQSAPELSYEPQTTAATFAPQLSAAFEGRLLTDEAAPDELAQDFANAMGPATPATDSLALTGSEQVATPSNDRPNFAALIPTGFAPNRLTLGDALPNTIDDVLSTVEQASVAIRSGDTMMDLLTDIGIDRTEAHYAIEAFGDVYNPRRIRAGQEFNVAYEVLPPVEQGSANDEAFRLVNLSMRTAPDQEVLVRWDEEADEYVSEARDIELEERWTRGRGSINSSLYLAANEIGVPDAVTVDLIRIFSHSVDFQRDIREGDSFDVYYSRRYDEDGEPAMNGHVEFASLVTRGREQRLYRYETPDDGLVDYYDQAGQSVRAFLMRTPIDGARITSSFGPRRHPVLGYNRMHKGVDFGAPTGTPIYAAGNGTIVRASRYGSYGNYVRIRHANGYETAYAHLNGYGPGIRSGVRVEQGQVIGYVGATGRVTGAHLHYEVLYNDDQVNPRTIDLPSGRELEGEILEAFQTERVRIESQMARAPVLEVSTAASAGGGATPHADMAPE